ncbi:DUF721 domain-containing protein [Singulisphaera sp. PoT]|uniref:DUF721 domain-containing protein n=1 Tax=Singulisphaera sp. PoT TaxID=3411797 RepID=UPI003BF52E11
MSAERPAGGSDSARPSGRGQGRNETRHRNNADSSDAAGSSRYRGPKPLGDILGDLFALRGLGRLRAQKELEDAWNAAAGEAASRHTRVGEVRRGILHVTVAHSALLEELAAFQKPALLSALRQNAPGTLIHDIRFRVGPITPPADPPASAPGATKPRSKPASGKGKRRSRSDGDEP